MSRQAAAQANPQSETTAIKTELEQLRTQRNALERKIGALQDRLAASRSGASPIRVAALSGPVSFDGKWKFRFVYDDNNPIDCIGGGLFGTVKVDQNRIKGFFNDAVAGSYSVKAIIGNEGTVEFEAIGFDNVTGTGSFRGEQASGSWRSHKYFCHGTWTAKRK